MKVGIIMGSKSDLDTMKKASAVLDEFKIPYEMVIASAHRTPEAVKNFVTRLEDEGALKGIDSLLAIVQMPSGMPVATMAVDGAKNAALFAVQIGAAFNKDLKEQYQQYHKDMAEKVLADNAELQGAIHI